MRDLAREAHCDGTGGAHVHGSARPRPPAAHRIERGTVARTSSTLTRPSALARRERKSRGAAAGRGEASRPGRGHCQRPSTTAWFRRQRSRSPGQVRGTAHRERQAGSEANDHRHRVAAHRHVISGHSEPTAGTAVAIGRPASRPVRPARPGARPSPLRCAERDFRRSGCAVWHGNPETCWRHRAPGNSVSYLLSRGADREL